MDLHKLDIQGHYEDQADVSERLQLVEPGDELTRDLVSWAILPAGETIEDDDARPGYVFYYNLGAYLERGLYRLTMSARDESGSQWEAEIAAGLVATAASAEAGRTQDFVPFWFLSEHLHFKVSDKRVAERYGGVAFGRLGFNRPGVLPHDRLFRATV